MRSRAPPESRRTAPVAGDAVGRVAEVVGRGEIDEEVVAGLARGRAGVGDALARDVDRHLGVGLADDGALAEGGGQRVGVR